jgi:hypothetical protein
MVMVRTQNKVAVKALTSKAPGNEDCEMVDEYEPESSDAYVENTKSADCPEQFELETDRSTT